MHVADIIANINDPERQARLKARYENQDYLKLSAIETGYMLSGNELERGFLGLFCHTEGFKGKDFFKGIEAAYPKAPELKETMNVVSRFFPDLEQKLVFTTVVPVHKNLAEEVCQGLRDLNCRSIFASHAQLNKDTNRHEKEFWFVGVPEIQAFKSDKAMMFAYLLEKGVITEKDIEAIDENPVNPLINAVREKIKNISGRDIQR